MKPYVKFVPAEQDAVAEVAASAAEANTAAQGASSKIGNLNSLQTTSKSSVVSAINEVRNLAQQAKNSTPTIWGGGLVASETEGYDYDFTPVGSISVQTGDYLYDEANSRDEFTILAYIDDKYYIATANGIESVRIVEVEPEEEEEPEEVEEVEEEPQEEEPGEEE